METRQNATIYVGQDATLQFAVVDANGDAVDLSSITGAAYRVATDLSKDADSIVLTKTLGAGVTGADDGTATVTLADTDTDDLTGGAVYFHELAVLDSTGAKLPTAIGLLYVRKSTAIGGL